MVLAVLAAAAIAATTAVRHYLHPAQLTAALAERIKASTGRDVSISGPVELRFFPRPAIVVEDLRFGNAPWGSQPWMARIGRAEAEFPWRTLLADGIDVTRLSVADLTLLLETDASGNGNWVMGRPNSGPTDLTWLTTFDADELTLQRFKLGYRDGATGKTTELALDEARLQVPAAPQPIAFRTRGSHSGKGFEVEGRAGALVTLLAGGSYPISFSAVTGKSRMEASGELGRPLELTDLSVNLRVESADLADLEPLLPHFDPLPAEHVREWYRHSVVPFRASAQLAGSWNAFSLSGVEVAIGGAATMAFRAAGRMEMRLTASRQFEVPAIDLELQAHGPEFSKLLALGGKSFPAVGPYAMFGRLSGSWDTPRLSAVEVEVGARERVHVVARGAIARPREPAGFDLRMVARADRHWRTGAEAGAPRMPPFQLKTRVRDRPDGYALDELELEVAGSKLDATLVATRSEGRLRIAGKAASPLIDLARVVDRADPAAATGENRTEREAQGALPALIQFADLDLELQVGKLALRDRRTLTGVSGRLALTREGLAVSSGRLSAGGAQWRVQGRVSNPAQGSGIDLALELRGSELADLVAFWGGRLPLLGPYQGSARAQGTLEVLRLTAIEARAGKSGQTRFLARGEIADAMRGEGFDLALSADISDPGFLTRFAGKDLPRFPPLKLAAHFSNPRGRYEFDDVKLAAGRTSLQGRLVYVPAEPRPQIRTVFTGTMLDLSEIRMPEGGRKAASRDKEDPSKTPAVDAEFRLDRLVLPDKRDLGPVSGRTVLSDGVAELQQLSISAPGASALVHGTVASPLRASGLNLAVKAQVKESAALTGLAGVEIPSLPPFTLSGQLTDVENGYALSDMEMAFAATKISGDLTAIRVGSRLAVRASLTSSLFDLSEFLADTPGAAGSKPTADTRVFSDAPLPFGILRAADATLDLRIETLRVPQIAPLGPATARLALAGGRLKADPVRIGTPAGEELEISGTVKALPGEKPGFALRIEGKSIDLGSAVGQAQKRINMSGGATDFKFRLSSRGGSVRALMDALEGSAWISVGPARIHNESVDFGTGLIQRVLDLVNPFRKTDPDTDLTCIAIRVSIADGVITSDRGIAVETKKFNAVASGTVNLGTEALALGLTPSVNERFSLGADRMAQNVRIGGTLADPDIRLDVAGTAKSAVSLYADVATAGGWYLVDTLLRRSKPDPHPCATALGEAR